MLEYCAQRGATHRRLVHINTGKDGRHAARDDAGLHEIATLGQFGERHRGAAEDLVGDDLLLQAKAHLAPGPWPCLENAGKQLRTAGRSNSLA